MFCVKCGTKLSEGVRFCKSCGSHVSDTKEEKTNQTNVDSPSEPEKAEAKSPISSEETVSTNTETMPAKSEAIIHGYSEAYAVNMEIKVYCNGQYVGIVGKDETIVVPITTDSLLRFKCSFRSAQISVKSGMRSELKLEWNRGSGKLHVFDLQASNATENMGKLAKGNKKWMAFPVILVAVGVIASAIRFGFFMTEHKDNTNNNKPSVVATQTSTPKSPDLSTVTKAYNDFLNQYGITPHSGDDTNSTDYLIEDIIGDSTPELIIYGDSFDIRDDNYRNTKDIYGYDNNKGETFQYRGETQIIEPYKGKDIYCVGGTHSEGNLFYYIYEASGNMIKLVQQISYTLPSGNGSDIIMYQIGLNNEIVNEESYNDEISKYMDISSLSEKIVGEDSNTVDNTPQHNSSNSNLGYVKSADGVELLVGSLVYARQNIFGVSANWVRGNVVSIDSADSVNVAWDTFLENRLFTYDENPIYEVDSGLLKTYHYYSQASGQDMQLTGVNFNLPANQLYAHQP